MAATSVSRSSRADGLHQPHQHYSPRHYSPSLPVAHLKSANTRSHHNMAGHFPPSQPRPKRPLDHPEQNHDAVKRRKQNKFVVEIPAKLASQRFQQQNNTGRPPMHAGSRPSPLSAPQPRPPANRDDPTKHHPKLDAVAAAAAPLLSHQPDDSKPTIDPIAPKPTEHKKKVANGLKHELDRLQPSEADTQTQGRRKLRSQEAIRFKSELSAYFPDYDEVIGNDPKEHHILNIDTPIVVTDSRPTLSLPTPTLSNTTYTHLHSLHDIFHIFPVRSYGDHLSTDLFDAQKVGFDWLPKTQLITRSDVDPLSNTVYEHSHKKSERWERSQRTKERGRAQHERDQVIRLLGGLQGPDWLKIMGVSGITESKKKTFEPARAHFIKGCHAIIDKFKAWAAEEKRRKLEKERKAREQTEAEEEEEEEEEVEEEDIKADDEDQEKVIPDSQEEEEDEAMEDVDGDLPDSSDVDASIAKQLREEALAAAKTNSRSRAKSSLRSVSAQPPVQPPQPAKEFTSFFSKPYQRTLALNRNRRRGRTVLAWGQALPDLPESNFELPEEYRNGDTLKANARKRRTEKRHRK